MLAEVNAGIYVKLGQHLAQMQYLLPRAYVEALSPLCYRAPRSGWASVEAVLREELGAPPTTVFSSLSTSPVASASLAQVHVGILRAGGTRVAVKVQHAGLRETCVADIATLRALCAAARALFPRFDLSWLADEVGRNLPLELDFVHEAANMEAAGAAYATGGRDDVVVPSVALPPTPRLLVMTFEDGAHVDDRRGIAARGLSPAAVARLVAEAFNEAIFDRGVVNCDPHPGNLLVRAHPRVPGRPQLVVLDHGLVRKLEPDVRLAYAALWNGLLCADEAAVRDASARLGVSEPLFRLFASMLTAKTWPEIAAARTAPGGAVAGLRLAGTADEAAATAGHAREYAAEIAAVLRAVPRDLLLILKTGDCLRGVDAGLGAPVNTLTVTARAAARAIERENAREAAAAGPLRAAWHMLAAATAALRRELTLAWLAFTAAASPLPAQDGS